MALNNFYKSKKIFITGQTGFKGSWLSFWLSNLGAVVSGYALKPENKSLFNFLKLEEKISSKYGNINNLKKLKEQLRKAQPEIIFHLAAQPLVIDSYKDPINTFSTNVMGTINLLEATRDIKSVKVIVVVTTDKCYFNQEWDRPYREDDRLGGHDPYSASKAMAELATEAYKRSFLKENNVGIATARAGNVIGGGDFGKHRLIPDFIKSIEENKKLVLRNPKNIRPWQHVLDCLHGYLLLGEKLFNEPTKYSSSFNFGPAETFKVEEMIFKLSIGLNYQKNFKTTKGVYHESKILKLDSTKAITMLNWKAHLNITETIDFTAQWYKSYLNKENLEQKSLEQIEFFNRKINAK